MAVPVFVNKIFTRWWQHCLLCPMMMMMMAIVYIAFIVWTLPYGEFIWMSDSLLGQYWFPSEYQFFASYFWNGMNIEQTIFIHQTPQKKNPLSDFDMHSEHLRLNKWLCWFYGQPSKPNRNPANAKWHSSSFPN